MRAVNGESEKYLIAEIIVSGITTGFLLNKAVQYFAVSNFYRQDRN
jgi:hypothetical protein